MPTYNCVHFETSDQRNQGVKMSSLPRAMDAMERFNRRTISFSSRQDVMNEVAEILQGEVTLEEDEESIASDDVSRDHP